MTKVLCLISHGVYKPWIQILHDGQEVTWLSDPMPDNFKVVHFHGTPVGRLGQKIDELHEKIRWSTRLKATILRYLDLIIGFPFRAYVPSVSSSKILEANHDVLHIHQPDIYATYKWKEVGIFAYVLRNFDFDYVFTTTSSSYIIPQTLLQLLEDKPKSSYYGGMIPYSGADFASGSNRVFSRDVIELIVRERRNISCGLIEDVSIAKLLRDNGILPDSLYGLNLEGEKQVDDLTRKDITKNYHFRLKSGTLQNRQDVKLFKRLHNSIKNL